MDNVDTTGRFDMYLVSECLFFNANSAILY